MGMVERFAEMVADRVIAKVEAQRGAQVNAQQQAASLVKGVASDLSEAGSALDMAAERLRSAGDPFGANQAKAAALRARNAAQGIGAKG